ncbi:MAG: redoxin family protein [Gemmataceae bacterium]|nr:redoxin family protein [Gemmata sp.]MDW8196014.1 redoxin family protein [Gemmataceae bacterium]
MVFFQVCGYWLVPVLLGMTGNGIYADPPAAKPIQDEFVDVLGERFRWPSSDNCKAVVLIFIGYDCPISNGYAPEVIRLCKEYTAKGVAFCVVYADADIPIEQARQHAKEYGYNCPAILDPQMTLVRKVGATVKPEAAVLSPQGELLYRGRINNLYIDYGKKRPQPTQHDLKEALEAVLANKPVPVTRTRAIGCYIDVPDKKP